MFNLRILRIMDLFQPLFLKLKIDYPLLRSILAVKLLMDERRIPTIFNNSKSKNKNPFVNSLWIYSLYGFVLVFFVFGEAYMLQMSIIFGIALFILTTSIIADFSHVILDTRDTTIMNTKPVDHRTAGIAKFIHILIYLTLLVGAFAIIPILFMLFVQGIVFTALFIFMLVLFMLFIIATSSLVYILVLKFFSGEQLRSIINYMQIIFVVGIIIGYQVIIRTYSYIDLHASYVFQWWHAVLPPFWFAAPFELVMNHNMSPQIIILSLLSIVSIATIILYYWSIPTFETNLRKLSEITRSKTTRGSFWEDLWMKLLCRTGEQGVCFQFVYKIVHREREFKLKVYPSLGIGLVLPFIFPFSIVDVNTPAEITASNLYFYIYLMQVFIGIALFTFQFSNSFKGAWIFTMSNRNVSIQLYEAVMKVFLVKIYLPMFLVVGVCYYIFFLKFHLIDLMIVFVSAVIQALLSYKLIMRSNYPFSLSFSKLTEEGNTIKAILLILLAIPFVGLHLLITFIPFGLYAYLILLIVTAIVLWKSFYRYKQTEPVIK